MHLGQTDGNDNIDCCRYLELEEVKTIVVNDSKSSKFSLVFVNVVSLDRNIDKLRTMLYGMDSSPDIIGVSETRINDNNISSCDCDLRGYNIIYDNSPNNGRAGGAVYSLTTV